MHRRILGAGLVVCVAIAALAGCSSDKSTKQSGAAVPQDGGFGSMTKVCGPARAKNAAGKTTGLTANSIAITTISDAGSSLQPGVNQEFWDVAEVFANWCNDQGGIHGRKIVVNEGNAQLVEYEQAMKTACEDSFALVGGGGVFDNLGQDTRIACNLPDFPAFQASSQMRTADLVYTATATPMNQRTVGLIRLLGREFPTSVERPGFIYGDFASVKMIKAQLARAMEQTSEWQGHEPVYQSTYAVTGGENWSKFAREVKANRVTALMFAGQPRDLANLVSAIDASNNTDLQWIFSEPNGYDQVYTQNVNRAAGATPVFMPLYSTPFEVAGQSNPNGQAMQQYLDLVEKYLTKGKGRTLLSVNAFASWLLFAQAASQCGANLTRDCLVENVQKITSFDAGGLLSQRTPSDPTQASQCFTAVQAVPTTKAKSGFVVWSKVKPNQGIFNCAADNRVDLQLEDSFFQTYPKGPQRSDPTASLDGEHASR